MRFPFAVFICAVAPLSVAAQYGTKSQPQASWPGLAVPTTPPVPLQIAPLAHMTMGAIQVGSGAGTLPNSVTCWGSSCDLGAPVHFPYSGTYNFVMSACLVGSAFGGGAYEGLARISIDQVPIGVGNGFVQQITNFANRTTPCTNPVNYTFSAMVLAGNHFVELWLYSYPNQSWVTNIDINLAEAGSVPNEPPGARDATLQPMSSWSMWNTAIGSGAVWSNPGDPDTLAITGTTARIINTTQWSVPVYTGLASDPVQAFHTGDVTFVAAGDAMVHMPAGMVAAPPVSGGDHTIALYDATNPRWQYSGFGCTVGPGINCGRSQIFDQCNGFNNATGQGSGQIPGLIRSWEAQAGSIKHMLLFALATQLVAPVSTPWTGLGWPAWESDYNGAFGLYTGKVLYGSTIGIPSTVDVTALGLSASGLAMAHALQDYGAMLQVTGGQPNNQITFYAEQDISGDASQITAMQAALATLIPLTRIMRNQGPSSINGGGTRRQPLLPGLAACH